jgi:hypothetical protein
MEAFLTKHGPGAAENRVKASLKRDQRHLTLSFEVHKRTSKPWLADEKFTDDWSKNWGLWNTDVVEAFLQLRQDEQDLTAPYLEVQVSPLNQPFALVIKEPRKKFFAPAKLEMKTTTTLEGRTWKATLEFTLPDEITGEHLYGGFFSCLETNPREYYALEPNPEEAPDFHRPELFLKLDQ